MLSYVLSTGFHHLAHVDPRSSFVLDALESLGSDVRHYPSHWERLCEVREEELRWPYPPWPSSRHDFEFYILTAYSSARHLELFLSRRHLIKARIGTNPLVYAADMRKAEHAMVLLEFGADVNKRSLDIDDSHWTSPLEVSIDRGDDVFVGELLQRGCLLPSDLLATTVCLPWCSTRVLLKLMETDEFVEWAHNIGDEKLYRGVFNSARPDAGDMRKTDEDHVMLARRLRQLGQDLTADSPFGKELIERAVDAAHTSMLEFLLPQDEPPPSRFLLTASTGDTSETVLVVRYLLEKGVDIQTVSDGSRNTALHLAAMCAWEPRSLELTRLLLAAGCDPHVRNSRGETPLTIAVEREYISVAEIQFSFNNSLPSDILLLELRRRPRNTRTIQWLTDRGANVHAITSGEDTVLHLAIAWFSRESECLDLVERFINAGCDPTARNNRGKTVLEAALARGYTTVVEHLLARNHPVPREILLAALQHSSTPQIVEALVCKGANVHSTTSKGDTVLHLAIAHYQEPTCLDLVKSFINAGCDPAACNTQGETVLEATLVRGYTSVAEHLLACNHAAPHGVLLAALQFNMTPLTVEVLLCKGVNVHFTTSEGDTVLHLAIARYRETTCLDLVKRFINAGCSPTACNAQGKTVLGAASERGYTSVMGHLIACNHPVPHEILLAAPQPNSTARIVEALLCKGANTRSITPECGAILHLAIVRYPELECLDLVKKFINAGWDPTACSAQGVTVLEAALERRHTSVVEHLLACNHPVPREILLAALQFGSAPQIVKALLCRGANVHSTTSEGDTILHLAIARYRKPTCLDLVERFINAGCDPTTSNAQGKTVLEAALECRFTSVVEDLLARDHPVPRESLLAALQHSSTPQIVEALVCKGANIHSTTSEGDTVLHLAITRYRETTCLDLVKRFINAGCNPAICNARKESVLAAAIARRYHSVVKYLLSCNAPVSPDILESARRYGWHS